MSRRGQTASQRQPARGKDAALQDAAAAAADTGVAWRVPSVKELTSLIVRSTINPAIDTLAFPNTPAAGAWSATRTWTPAGPPGTLSFICERVANTFRTDAFGGYGVRLVRPPVSSPGPCWVRAPPWNGPPSRQPDRRRRCPQPHRTYPQSFVIRWQSAP